MGETTSTVAAEQPQPLLKFTHRHGDWALCAFLVFTASIRAANGIDSASDGDWLLVANHAVVASAMLINAVLCLMRGPAIARSQGWLMPVIAVGGGYLVTALALLPMTWEPDWLIAITTVAVTFSYALIIWALLTLKRSFSVVPEARRLITHGPYARIRHPLYAGYFVSYLCFALPRISIWAIMIGVAGVGCEIYRSLQEEKILSSAFPDYDDYARRVPRFFPRFGKPAWKVAVAENEPASR
jgi:protein-S-isoprenylcysteine O-methyltransferase Ste14